MTAPAFQPIEAAGAVLWREEGGTELVALVHRPAYDDWTLPKGKARRSEHPLLVALREVHEETGWTASPGVPLPDQRYLKEGRPKVVHLHAMRGIAGSPLDPEVEVDAVRWLPLPEAIAAATWERDIASLEHFAQAPRRTRALVLLRHASAGDRASWSGADTDRPLDDIGEQQAGLLAELLAAYEPVRVLSSPAARCTDSVAPLAKDCGLTVELDESLSEDDYDPEAATLLLAELVRDSGAAVVCTHGPVLADLVERFVNALGQPPTGAARVAKGGAWVMHVEEVGALAGMERLPAP